jgi:hypothetical protein
VKKQVSGNRKNPPAGFGGACRLAHQSKSGAPKRPSTEIVLDTPDHFDPTARDAIVELFRNVADATVSDLGTWL